MLADAAGGVGLPAEAWAAITAAIGVISAVVTVIYGPRVQARLTQRAERDARETSGWQEAVTALKGRVTEAETQTSELRKELAGLRTQVAELRERVTDQDHTIDQQRSTIAEQSRLIRWLQARVRQLEAAWPPGFTLPVADPALTTPPGGIGG